MSLMTLLKIEKQKIEEHSNKMNCSYNTYKIHTRVNEGKISIANNM